VAKRALIYGVSGQDGAYLAKLLLKMDTKLLALRVMLMLHICN